LKGLLSLKNGFKKRIFFVVIIVVEVILVLIIGLLIYSKFFREEKQTQNNNIYFKNAKQVSVIIEHEKSYYIKKATLIGVAFKFN